MADLERGQVSRPNAVRPPRLPAGTLPKLPPGSAGSVPAAEVIVWGDGRVSFVLSNREFEVVVVPTLIEAMGRQGAAEATAEVLRGALGARSTT